MEGKKEKRPLFANKLEKRVCISSLVIGTYYFICYVILLYLEFGDNALVDAGTAFIFKGNPPFMIDLEQEFVSIRSALSLCDGVFWGVFFLFSVLFSGISMIKRDYTEMSKVYSVNGVLFLGAFHAIGLISILYYLMEYNPILYSFGKAYPADRTAEPLLNVAGEPITLLHVMAVPAAMLSIGLIIFVLFAVKLGRKE